MSTNLAKLDLKDLPRVTEQSVLDEFFDGLRQANKDDLQHQLYVTSLYQFCCRILEAHKKGKIDNSRLPAGSPMYFYCIACGLQSDTQPEGYTCRPKRSCDACLKMDDWLRDAVALASHLGLVPPVQESKGPPELADI